jgi:hypothetical protein
MLEEITNKPTIDDNVDDNVFVAIEPMRRDSTDLTTEELVSKPICFFLLPHSFIFLVSLPEKKNRKKLLQIATTTIPKSSHDDDVCPNTSSNTAKRVTVNFANIHNISF